MVFSTLGLLNYFMRIVGFIPARYASTRFPAKPLQLLLGVPMIVRVAAIAARALGIENTYVITDDERIASVVRKSGYQTLMTSATCLTGTDRLAEASLQIAATSYINIQGDEPMLEPENIVRVAKAHQLRPDVVWNAMAQCSENDDVHSFNLPKVIVSESGKLIYMSRVALPGFKDQKNAPLTYWKPVSIYGFTRWQLQAFSAYGHKSVLEQAEDIEILRFLELGIPVQMLEVSGGSLAVDIPEDVPRVEAAMRRLGMV
jgi:3-deoxy-manno-octulosonate cytidylyltransferase (CMP-KDO synthetase)